MQAHAIARWLFHLEEMETPPEPLERKVKTSDINVMWEVWSPRETLQMPTVAGTEGSGRASCTLSFLSPGNALKSPPKIQQYSGPAARKSGLGLGIDML